MKSFEARLKRIEERRNARRGPIDRVRYVYQKNGYPLEPPADDVPADEPRVLTIIYNIISMIKGRDNDT